MFKIKFVVVFISIITIGVISCKKSNNSFKIEIKEQAEKIAKQDNFKVFLKEYFVGQAGFAKNRKKYDDLNSRRTSESDSIIEDNIIEIKNRIDNQTLGILVSNPLLLDMDSVAVYDIIKTAIDYRLTFTDSSSVAEVNQINTEINNVMQSTISGRNTTATGLTIDEVWDCIKSGAGLSGKAMLSIAGLQALAKQGVQEVVKTVSKYLFKRLGWIGAAIMVIDTASCIYAQYND
jgi:hypothetical protein